MYLLKRIVNIGQGKPDETEQKETDEEKKKRRKSEIEEQQQHEEKKKKKRNKKQKDGLKSEIVETFHDVGGASDEPRDTSVEPESDSKSNVIVDYVNSLWEETEEKKVVELQRILSDESSVWGDVSSDTESSKKQSSLEPENKQNGIIADDEIPEIRHVLPEIVKSDDSSDEKEGINEESKIRRRRRRQNTESDEIDVTKVEVLEAIEKRKIRKQSKTDKSQELNEMRRRRSRTGDSKTDTSDERKDVFEKSPSLESEISETVPENEKDEALVNRVSIDLTPLVTEKMWFEETDNELETKGDAKDNENKEELSEVEKQEDCDLSNVPIPQYETDILDNNSILETSSNTEETKNEEVSEEKLNDNEEEHVLKESKKDTNQNDENKKSGSNQMEESEKYWFDETDNEIESEDKKTEKEEVDTFWFEDNGSQSKQKELVHEQSSIKDKESDNIKVVVEEITKFWFEGSDSEAKDTEVTTEDSTDQIDEASESEENQDIQEETDGETKECEQTSTEIIRDGDFKTEKEDKFWFEASESEEQQEDGQTEVKKEPKEEKLWFEASDKEEKQVDSQMKEKKEAKDEKLWFEDSESEANKDTETSTPTEDESTEESKADDNPPKVEIGSESEAAKESVDRPTENGPPEPDDEADSVAEVKSVHRRSFKHVLQDIEQPRSRKKSVVLPDVREIEAKPIQDSIPSPPPMPPAETSDVTDHSIMDYLGKETDKAEARLAARRQARVEAREIRMRELERQQKEQEASTDKVYDSYNNEPVVVRPNRTSTVMSPRDRTTSSRRSSEDSLEEGLSLRDVRYELKEVDDKFKKAMIANAQLDNEKCCLAYQVELLKDRLEDLEETHAQLTREHKEKCREHEQLKRAVIKLKEDLDVFKYEVTDRDRMIEEYGLVIIEDQTDGEMPKRVLVSANNAELLKGDKGCSLDVRLKKLAEDKNELTDQVRHLKLELEEERSKKRSGLTNGVDYEEEREACKQLGDYKFRLQKAEQDVSTLQANVARLESQVIRYKSAAESSEKAEDELKIEKRKLQRELRESIGRIEELETSNSHLQRRMDKLKNAKSTLLKEL